MELVQKLLVLMSKDWAAVPSFFCCSHFSKHSPNDRLTEWLPQLS
ncbi:hypothetical protein D920_03014 [Enterococcus faecalis 13-SD-W-01]|nr:hypothetical protein D920_03014 [Enterococcus faecalis 13-SD-W-01]